MVSRAIPATGLCISTVGEDVVGTHTSMRSNLAAGYLPLVEQPHQKKSSKPAADRPPAGWSVRRAPVSVRRNCHGPSDPASPEEAAPAWAGIWTDSASVMPNRTGTGSVASLNSASFEAVRAAKTTSLSLTRLVALFSPVRSSIGPPPSDIQHTSQTTQTQHVTQTNLSSKHPPSGRTSQRLDRLLHFVLDSCRPGHVSKQRWRSRLWHLF